MHILAWRRGLRTLLAAEFAWLDVASDHLRDLVEAFIGVVPCAIVRGNEFSPLILKGY